MVLAPDDRADTDENDSRRESPRQVNVVEITRDLIDRFGGSPKRDYNADSILDLKNLSVSLSMKYA